MVLWIGETDSLVMARLVSWLNLAAICHSLYSADLETRSKPSFQISLTWQVSTRVGGVEIQSLVQYWIKTVCCRSKDHFHWTPPPYSAGPKSGGTLYPHPTVALAMTRVWKMVSRLDSMGNQWQKLHDPMVISFVSLPAYDRLDRHAATSIAEHDKNWITTSYAPAPISPETIINFTPE